MDKLSSYLLKVWNRSSSIIAVEESYDKSPSARSLAQLMLLYFIKNMKKTKKQQLFYGLLSGTTQVSWYQMKHLPTHTYPDHEPSFISFLHLL